MFNKTFSRTKTQTNKKRTSFDQEDFIEFHLIFCQLFKHCTSLFHKKKEIHRHKY